MNIISIALKEIKSDFRDIKTFILLLAFPIVLMLILGAALSNAFDSTPKIDTVHVLYQPSANGQLDQSFQAFAKAVADDNVQFEKATSNSAGKKAVQENKADGYVEITNGGMKLYENDTNSIQGSIIEGMLSAFADKYNVAKTVYTIAPNQVEQVLKSSGQGNSVKETTLNSVKQPGAMDYYAITMTTMIALFGALSAIYLIRGERKRGTAARLVAAPVTKMEIFIGKILGAMVTSTLCTLVVVFFSKFMFKANWGNHLGVVFLVLLTEIFLAISFGLGVSYIMKTEGAARMVVMVIVQSAAFFGGSYFQIDDAGGLLAKAIQLSPLNWANTALTKAIYANEFTPAWHTALLNVGIAVLFLLITIGALQRREGL
ncbi:ABC transporter permease [Pullulanibacillus camelliae]|uniref:ABC transporter permease n=1 Tax=Pullulanibacillus camelliae TaxID=1707096 RepID=A0A8J2YFT5_9BACL|nr:ABC transporter permease [Pullulanibacillus camelliae]GGE34580.1 ABC transporter permease [Pullulanibacillus camelliae]